MEISKPVVAVFDTKPHDRDYLASASAGSELDWRFNEFRLEAKTAFAAGGAQAACVFVNDALDRSTLEQLAGSWCAADCLAMCGI